MKKQLKKMMNVESDFFELDKTNKTAYIKLEYDSVDDIFYSNIVSKKPIIKDEIKEEIISLCDYIPKNYRVDILIGFKDMNGYETSYLEELFVLNINLEFKKIERKVISKNNIAIALFLSGLIFLTGLLLVEGLWNDGGTIKTIVTFILNIIATVTIWEAMTILIVKTEERRLRMNSIAKRFAGVHFVNI